MQIANNFIDTFLKIDGETNINWITIITQKTLIIPYCNAIYYVGFRLEFNFAVLDSRTFWTIKGAKNIGSTRHHFKWQNYLTFLTLVWNFSKIHQVSNEKFLPFFNQSETIVHFGQAVLLTFDLISWKKYFFVISVLNLELSFPPTILSIKCNS